MIHQSKCTVGPGELTASFPLRLRNSGFAPPGGFRYNISLVSLYGAAEEIIESDYGMTMALQFSEGQETYNSFFQKPFGVGSTPGTVAVVLEGYYAKAKANYPYMTRIPRLKYEAESATTGRFVASLPPFTSLYCTVDAFWQTIGYEPGSYEEFPGSVMKNTTATVLAYGFRNVEPDQVEITSRLMQTNNEPLKAIYEMTAGPSPTQQPRLEFRFHEDVLPLHLARARPMTKSLAADGIATVLEDALHLLSLDPSAISIEAFGKNFVFKSKEYRRVGKDEFEPHVSIKVGFSDELKDFLQLTERSLLFPLSDARSYEVEPRDESNFDPLAEFYPISLLCDKGPADNYVEGRGFTSMLAVMKGVDDFTGGKIAIGGECEEITLRFLDKRLQPVKLRDRETTFILTLELEPLF